MKLPLSVTRRPGTTFFIRFALLFSGALLSRSYSADAPALGPAIVPTDPNAYVKAAQTSPAPLAGGDQQKRIYALWADDPAIVRWLNDKEHAKKPARIQSTVQPVPPLVPAIPGKPAATVMVSLIVDETGGVEAARVLESDDPRFNQAAIDAVLQWRFFPAEGAHGFMKANFLVPITFKGERAEDIAIRLNVLRPQRLRLNGIDLRPKQTPPPPETWAWSFTLQLQGPGAADAKAGRVIIHHAADDTGTELPPSSPAMHYHVGVGSISADDMVRTPLLELGFSFDGVSPAAKKIVGVEGVIELVIPRLDPTGAKAVIENVLSHVGSPVTSDALRAAGVAVVMYDKATCDRYLADKAALGGPAEYDCGPLFSTKPSGMSLSTSFSTSKSEVSAGDLAIGISDPQGNLVGVEFQAADGQPLRYDHNGWYHSDTGSGKRFDVYKLGPKIPADAKLVCWLITPRAVQKIPLKLAELPLPDSGR